MDDYDDSFTLEDARGWIENAISGCTLRWGIFVNGLHVGGVSIYPHEGERSGVAEIGYFIGRTYWDNGFAREAIRLSSEYAFQVMGIRRLEAHVFACNDASRRVLTICGFQKEALLHDAFTDRNGKICDAALYTRQKRERLDTQPKGCVSSRHE